MILYGVLQGLHALHEAKLVHGTVHPNNVFVNDGGLGILADYDFSKPEVGMRAHLGKYKERNHNSVHRKTGLMCKSTLVLSDN